MLTRAVQPPLVGGVKPSTFKLLFVDIGLMQHALGFDWSAVSLDDDLTTVHEGALAEQFVGQELLAATASRNLYYWTREKQGSDAEVDYLIVQAGKIVPIEVKSGTKGTLKSLARYLEEHIDSEAVVLSQVLPRREGPIRWMALYQSAQLAGAGRDELDSED